MGKLEKALKEMTRKSINKSIRLVENKYWEAMKNKKENNNCVGVRFTLNEISQIRDSYRDLGQS